MATRADARMALQLAGTLAGVGALHSRAGARRLLRARSLSATSGVERTPVDPLDAKVFEDPYPWYQALLRGEPVHYSRRRKLWIVSHYDAVREAGRADGRLSSAEGVTRFRARLPMLITTDKPEHTRLRKLAAHDFTRNAVEESRPAIERLATEAVDAMLSAPEADVVAQLASPLPVAVIAHVLGVPRKDLPEFRDWSDRIVAGFAIAPRSGSVRSSASVLGAAVRLHGYFREQFAIRRRLPGDDLLSALIASSEEGNLSEDELFWFSLLLLVAGNETTTSLLGAMVYALAEDPERYARLREEPTLVPSAVEESLRYFSPIQAFYRTATADYPVGRATIPAGARVLLLFAAANRDPRHFTAPDSFEVDRNPTDHLAFGSGIHFCLGAHLARLEGEIVLRELLNRVESLELVAQPTWNGNPTVRGVTRLRVRMQPARHPIAA